jgi:hypothetical protein
VLKKIILNAKHSGQQQQQRYQQKIKQEPFLVATTKLEQYKTTYLCKNM